LWGIRIEFARTSKEENLQIKKAIRLDGFSISKK
jgi:hypothetical protein